MWKSNVSITAEKTKHITKNQYEHQSERFYRIRYAYPQLRVTSMVPNQRTWSISNAQLQTGWSPQNILYKERLQKVKLLPVYCLQMLDLFYLSAFVKNCYDFDTGYPELVQPRTRQGNRNQKNSDSKIPRISFNDLND